MLGQKPITQPSLQNALCPPLYNFELQFCPKEMLQPCPDSASGFTLQPGHHWTAVWATLTYFNRSAKAPEGGTCPTTNTELSGKHLTVFTGAVLGQELKHGSSGVTHVSTHSVPGAMGAGSREGGALLRRRQSVCPANMVCTGLCHFCHWLRWCLGCCRW